MILFFSDIHFGNQDAAAERAKEADLVACLQAHRDHVEHLYLVGDVFHAYIEYRHLIPKGCVRFQALLAEWTEAGIPVTYLVGNHDPWHQDYFETELGVRVAFEPIVVQHGKETLYVAHGDGFIPDSPYNWLKPILRHPLPVWLYRNLLPGDFGMWLAKQYTQTFGHKGPNPNPRAVVALRDHAEHILKTTAATGVVMGHSHGVEQFQWPEGWYVNLGAWYDSHTFARLDDGSLNLLQWNGACPVAVEAPPANLVV